MIQACSRALVGVGFLFLALHVSGCAKRVPLEDGRFESSQRVLLTLDDGRTVQGKLGAGNAVQYRDGDLSYRARVASVTADSIRLDDLVMIDDRGSLEAVDSRLSDARLRISDTSPAVSVSREEIRSAELIQFDTWRTMRRTGFWAYGGALIVLLLGERS